MQHYFKVGLELSICFLIWLTFHKSSIPLLKLVLTVSTQLFSELLQNNLTIPFRWPNILANTSFSGQDINILQLCREKFNYLISLLRGFGSNNHRESVCQYFTLGVIFWSKFSDHSHSPCFHSYYGLVLEPHANWILEWK